MANEFIGKQIEVAIAKEASRGVAESSATRWLKKVKADIMVKEEKIIDDSTNARLESGEGSRIVKTWYEGTLEGIVHADAIGFLLENLYGTSADSGSVGAYSHVFTLDQSIIHSTFTLWNHDGAVKKQKFGGCMISSLEISASVDDYVRFKAEISGISTASSALTPSYSTEYDFIGKDITVKMASTEAGLVGATASKVKNATIKWDTGLIRDHVFGAYAPDNQYNSGMDIEISLTLNHNATTFLDLYTADTAQYLQITIQGTGNEGMVLLFHKVQVTDWTKGGDRDGLVTEEVTFKAFYNASDSKQSQVTLTNDTASY